VRLAADGFAGSGSIAGLGSRGALRFREGGGGRVDAAAAGALVEVPDCSEELAACLADARVILGDMSNCSEMNALNTGRPLCTTSRWS
jgi:hypothetical protein